MVSFSVKVSRLVVTRGDISRQTPFDVDQCGSFTHGQGLGSPCWGFGFSFWKFPKMFLKHNPLSNEENTMPTRGTQFLRAFCDRFEAKYCQGLVQDRQSGFIFSKKPIFGVLIAFLSKKLSRFWFKNKHYCLPQMSPSFAVQVAASKIGRRFLPSNKKPDMGKKRRAFFSQNTQLI